MVYCHHFPPKTSTCSHCCCCYIGAYSSVRLVVSVFCQLIVRTAWVAPSPVSFCPSVSLFCFPSSPQGVGGSFTHFYPGTHHALDFECPEGTSVLALANGTVKEVRQSNTAGGIHARGLFDWNSVRMCEGIRGQCTWCIRQLHAVAQRLEMLFFWAVREKRLLCFREVVVHTSK